MYTVSTFYLSGDVYANFICNAGVIQNKLQDTSKYFMNQLLPWYHIFVGKLYSLVKYENDMFVFIFSPHIYL